MFFQINVVKGRVQWFWPFLRVYRLEIKPVMLIFSTHLSEMLPLLPSLCFNLPPSCVNKYIVYTHSVCWGGGGYGVLCLRQINTCRKVPLQVNFFRWRHFALPFMSLIFLRVKHTIFILRTLACSSCRGPDSTLDHQKGRRGIRLCRRGEGQRPLCKEDIHYRIQFKTIPGTLKFCSCIGVKFTVVLVRRTFLLSSSQQSVIPLSGQPKIEPRGQSILNYV